ncbi:MAG: hypothetical protein FWC11_00555 [Firmicutes bacterium]|nr:hypothetical protein [Bacillota bacterium]
MFLLELLQKGIKDTRKRSSTLLTEKCKYTQNPTNQSKTVDKGFQPICERLLLRELLRQGHQRYLKKVFDPLDGECEYKQNPTKQSKTVDKGFQPF